MKSRFLIVLAVFAPLFFQPQNAVAVVGQAAQLVDNQQVSLKKDSLAPVKKMYPADNMAKAGLVVGIVSWATIIIPIIAPLAFFGFFVALGLGLAALRRKTVYRKKAVAAVALGASFIFLIVAIFVGLLLSDIFF